MPKVLARLANALDAVVATLELSVDGKRLFAPIAGTCSEVVRRRPNKTLVIPSDAECVGDGVDDRSRLLDRQTS